MSERRAAKFGTTELAAARAELAQALVATGQEDRPAFRRVYQLTSAKLFGICIRICGDRQSAEDVLQDVYITIWKRASGFEPGRASPISWLAAIARNRAIDWQRAAGARPSAPVEEALDVPDAAPSAIDAMLLGQADRRLHLCLDALEERQRDAIRTAFFEGVTYADLAERMATPLGTIKSWVRRGLLQLKDCLGAD
ncbi:sigma-70 family RNA polymerase sigma factor [Novosphingobium sp. G106]|uniref:sigma-70 family RNA polymerase sigma factor n=1 Tax=Novosphingobium sp. G106 TaxID=2849500 RepID=UPI001C2DD7B9|nr:sigma-70 family RNA polymerase sigma factor [Novosphingobium sp. G106]MBV1687751.1 sigma-70 family RNA polymerase sigma factor [Novosphingobium sp. G106]